MTIYDTIMDTHEDDPDESMIDPWLFAQLFLDWTNPEKLTLSSHA